MHRLRTDDQTRFLLGLADGRRASDVLLDGVGTRDLAVGRIDAPPGEHPATTGERQLPITPQQQHLRSGVAITQQDDGGGGHDRYLVGLVSQVAAVETSHQVVVPVRRRRHVVRRRGG